MPKVLFKFCSGEGAVSILKGNSIYVTSPLDLNDPFEMRPSWTDQHERNFVQDREARRTIIADNSAVAVDAEGHTKPIGRTSLSLSHPTVPVDSQYGIADRHNVPVFHQLHSRFRILSLVSNVFDIGQSHAQSKMQSTLMWSHYADEFQGVCLALNVASFPNGIRDGGFKVNYCFKRPCLPPSDYDCWQSLGSHLSGTVYQEDRASGLYLSPRDRVETTERRLRDLLLYKSPAWKYEQEIRMIYRVGDLMQNQAQYRNISHPNGVIQTRKGQEQEP